MKNNRDRIRVMHVITDLRFGGAQQLLLHLVKASDHQRFDHQVATLYGGETHIAESIRQAGVPVTDLKMKPKWRLDSLWRFYRLVRRESPLILHNWLFHAIVISRVVGRLCRVPVILSARHNTNIGGPLREKVNRWTSSLDDKVIAISEAVRQAEIQNSHIRPEKIITIYNGIPLNRLPTRQEGRARMGEGLNIPATAIVLTTVARLHPQKGHADLARLIPGILEKSPDCHFVWIGDGEEKDKLFALVNQLGIASHVHFTGSRSDIPYWLAGTDVFVFPSQWEGLGIALLEAMAAGLPVVATAVGGVREVVVDGQTGFLVPAQDPSSLVNALLQLANDPGLRTRMGQAGQRRVREHFSLEAMVRQTEQLYIELLQEHHVQND
jgi:glycosyltransferase involved in cell wall biosynthesis